MASGHKKGKSRHDEPIYNPLKAPLADCKEVMEACVEQLTTGEYLSDEQQQEIADQLADYASRAQGAILDFEAS